MTVALETGADYICALCGGTHKIADSQAYITNGNGGGQPVCDPCAEAFEPWSLPAFAPD